VEGLTVALGARPDVLAAAVVLDLLLGDPVYRLHPVRLIGESLSLIEKALRRMGADGYGGGIVLFVILAALWVVVVAFVHLDLAALGSWPAWLFHVFIV
jgi:adenosylcobinamide-phosphate synthase